MTDKSKSEQYAEGMGSLMTEDAIWEVDGIGKAQGLVEIRELFERFGDEILFSQHQVMNPIIEIQGDRAKGTWYFFGPFTFSKNNQARWLAARYEDDYVKAKGRWKIQHLRGRSRMATNFERSWATRRQREK